MTDTRSPGGYFPSAARFDALPDSLFRQYPAYTIPSTEQERKCLYGNPLRAKLPDGLYRVYGRDGAFLALS